MIELSTRVIHIYFFIKTQTQETEQLFKTLVLYTRKVGLSTLSYT